MSPEGAGGWIADLPSTIRITLALSGARASLLSGFAWGLGCSVAALAGILLAPEVDMAAGGALTLLIIPLDEDQGAGLKVAADH